MTGIMNYIKISSRWYIVLMSEYAEGKEREWLLKMKEMKVDFLQGYYFGRP